MQQISETMDDAGDSSWSIPKLMLFLKRNHSPSDFAKAEELLKLRDKKGKLEIDALRGEVEALRKRNEEVLQQGIAAEEERQRFEDLMRCRLRETEGHCRKLSEELKKAEECMKKIDFRNKSLELELERTKAEADLQAMMETYELEHAKAKAEDEAKTYRIKCDELQDKVKETMGRNCKLQRTKANAQDEAEAMRNTMVKIKLKKEQDQKEDKRRYKAQAHLCTIIKVARDGDLMEQIGKDIYFDLVDHDKVRSFRIQKQTPFKSFKEEVEREFGIPVHCQRFWMWAERQNHTYRPYRPLTAQEENQPVGQLREVSNKMCNAELKLFLEVEHRLGLIPVPPPEKSRDDILLFFKLYEPEKGELRYIGRLFVRSSGMPIEYIGKLNQMAGFAPDQEIELYDVIFKCPFCGVRFNYSNQYSIYFCFLDMQEIKFEPSVWCEPIDKRTSFRVNQIEDGDIMCFQKFLPLGSQEYKYPDVPSYLEYVHNRKL